MSDHVVSERPPATIVTSENLTDFNAQRMALKEPPKEPEPKAEAEPEEVEDDDKEEIPPPKPKGKINERMSELTAQRKAEEARATAAERRAAEAERERDELRAKLNPAPAPKPEPKDDEPQPGDYADAFEYARALSTFVAKQAVAEDRAAREKAESDKKANDEAQKVQTSWKTRVDAVKTATPDYDEVLEASDVQVSDPVRDALIESEYGPNILYLMAQEPEIAEKLEGMTILGQLREIGKLEARFEKPVEKPAPVVERPRAPAPIIPVRATKTADVKVNAEGEWTGTAAEWKAARKAGKV